MFLQNVHAVGHCGHDVHQSGTVRAQVLEDVAQQIEVARLVHLVEDGHDGLHRLALLVVALDEPRLQPERLLNHVVVLLHRGEEFIERRGCDLRHQSHSVRCRTEGQQFVATDSADVGQTVESFRELNDVRPGGRTGGTQLEYGRSGFLHRLLHAILLYQPHHLGHLGQLGQRLLTHVLAQGHLHLLGSLDEAGQPRNPVVLADTQLGTSVRKLVQRFNGISTVNLRNVAVQLVDVAHGQSRYLTDVGQRVAEFQVGAEDALDHRLDFIEARKAEHIRCQVLGRGGYGIALRLESASVGLYLALYALHVAEQLGTALVVARHILQRLLDLAEGFLQVLRLGSGQVFHHLAVLLHLAGNLGDALVQGVLVLDEPLQLLFLGLGQSDAGALLFLQFLPPTLGLLYFVVDAFEHSLYGRGVTGDDDFCFLCHSLCLRLCCLFASKGKQNALGRTDTDPGGCPCSVGGNAYLCSRKTKQQTRLWQ